MKMFLKKSYEDNLCVRIFLKKPPCQRDGRQRGTILQQGRGSVPRLTLARTRKRSFFPSCAALRSAPHAVSPRATRPARWPLVSAASLSPRGARAVPCRSPTLSNPADGFMCQAVFENSAEPLKLDVTDLINF
jgi:hypothetical protein